jgi:hypothetical protein
MKELVELIEQAELSWQLLVSGEHQHERLRAIIS